MNFTVDRDIVSLPSPMDAMDRWVTHATGQGLSLYLDFDGTLAEMVAHYEDAQILDGMLPVLRGLSAYCALAIVTGRDPEDVMKRVPLTGIPFAGNHGLRIIKSDGSLFEIDHGCAQDLEQVGEILGSLARRYKGVIVECKASSRVLHYRGLHPSDQSILLKELTEQLQRFPALEVKHGKMVREIQPKLNWNKGHAVQWLNEQQAEPVSHTIYIGDDLTDEDAFAALGDQGSGILVSSEDRATKAAFRLNDVPSVKEFLTRLLQDLQSA